MTKRPTILLPTQATSVRTLTRRAQIVCDSHDSLTDETKHLNPVFIKNNHSTGFTGRNTYVRSNDSSNNSYTTRATIPYIRGTSETIYGYPPPPKFKLVVNPNLQFKHSILQSKLAIIQFRHSFVTSNIQLINLNIQFVNSKLQFVNSNLQFGNSNIQFGNSNSQFADSNIQFVNSNLQLGNSNIQFGNSNIQFFNSAIQTFNSSIQTFNSSIRQFKHFAESGDEKRARGSARGSIRYRDLGTNQWNESKTLYCVLPFPLEKMSHLQKCKE